MNVELPRREEDLSTADPALGPPSSYHQGDVGKIYLYDKKR